MLWITYLYIVGTVTYIVDNPRIYCGYRYVYIVENLRICCGYRYVYCGEPTYILCGVTVLDYVLCVKCSNVR